jgi:hypothetical protein
MGVIFQLAMSQHTASAALVPLQGDQFTLGMAVKDQWPKESQADVPADVPPTVLRYFRQATASLRAQNFDAAGVMFRKTLEVATREKAPESASKPLVKRIDALSNDGLITSDMRDWAHEIRLGGNEAAHDDDPIEREDAERLNQFTDAFLRYAYTLPAMVKSNKDSE